MDKELGSKSRISDSENKPHIRGIKISEQVKIAESNLDTTAPQSPESIAHLKGPFSF